MTYRVICKFLPDAHVHAVGRPGRGAWRVVACVEATPISAAVLRPVLCISNPSTQLLVLASHKHRQPNSWCNPRKILAQWLKARGEARTALAACRAWTDECDPGPKDMDGLKAKDFAL